MASDLIISIKGEGNRKKIADALRALANDIHSDYLAEIYNIDGSSYLESTIEVSLKDKEYVQ